MINSPNNESYHPFQDRRTCICGWQHLQWVSTIASTSNAHRVRYQWALDVSRQESEVCISWLGQYQHRLWKGKFESYWWFSPKPLKELAFQWRRRTNKHDISSLYISVNIVRHHYQTPINECHPYLIRVFNKTPLRLASAVNVKPVSLGSSSKQWSTSPFHAGYTFDPYSRYRVPNVGIIDLAFGWKMNTLLHTHKPYLGWT